MAKVPGKYRRSTVAVLATCTALLSFNSGRVSSLCSASSTNLADGSEVLVHRLEQRDGTEGERPPRNGLNAETGKVEDGHLHGLRQQHQQQDDRDGQQQSTPHEGRSRTASFAHNVLAKHDPAYAMPEQVHIALAASASKDEYGMVVAWATWPETQSQVYWGPAPDDLGNLAEGSATTYSTHHPGRTDYTSGFLHSATLQGLKPSTTYYYSCGDKTMAMSSVRSFTTPPKIGEQKITLGILGDLGQTDDSAATLAAIDSDSALDVMLHAGDLSYADCDQPRWDSFMRLLDPVASRLPWMVAAGNHEIEAGSTGGKPFVAYEHRFRMPAVAPPVRSYECGTGGGLDGKAGVCGEGAGAEEAEIVAAMISAAATLGGGGGDHVDGVFDRSESAGMAIRDAAREVREAFDTDVSVQVRQEEEPRPNSCCPSEWSGTYDYGNSFYSFDVGPVHVVVMNPYAATGENSEQHEWLKKDLEAADRTLTPWVVAMMHCPWYNSNLAHQGERQAEIAMRVIEPLLVEHKVAIVVAGHVHAYERSHPVANYELTEGGPIHLVVGGAGNREGHAAAFYTTPEWSAFRDGTVYGSGRLSIQSPSLALWQWTAQASEGAAGVHDVAWISNPYSPYTPGEAPPMHDEAIVLEQEEEGVGSKTGSRLRVSGLAGHRTRFSM